MASHILLSISGMTCPHCEQVVEKALLALPCTQYVRADYNSGTAELTLFEEYTEQHHRPLFAHALQQEGYGLRDNQRAGLYATARSLAFFALIIAAFWCLSRAIPGQWTGYFPDPASATSLWALCGVGVLTSLHCLAMCGGIAMSQSMGRGPLASNRLSALLYQLGRFISYTALGGCIGGVGQHLALSPNARGAILLGAGVFMVLMALTMLGGFTALRRFLPRPPRWVRAKRQALLRETTEKHKGMRPLRPFLIGLLNGFMPCGPLQSMQLYALGTGSALAGASAMAMFCLGTMPALLGLGLISGKLGEKGKGRLLKAAAMLVMFLGFGMLHNGLAISGLTTAIPIATEQKPSSELKGAFAHRTPDGQAVTSMTDFDSYEPIVVERGLPVTWTLIVPEEKLIGCNNEILAPDLGISQKLEAGENQIKFTPTKSGVYSFTCWMGMIRSHITVVDAF